MKTAVVVERGAPEHRAVRHHAARHVFGFQFVTRTRTRLSHHTQIARIDKPHKLPTLARQKRVRSFRIRARVLAIPSPLTRKHRPHMRFLLQARNRIPTMTRRTTQPNGILSILEPLERLSRPILMHRLDLPMTRDTPLHLHRLLPSHEDDVSHKKHKNTQKKLSKYFCFISVHLRESAAKK